MTDAASLEAACAVFRNAVLPPEWLGAVWDVDNAAVSMAGKIRLSA